MGEKIEHIFYSLLPLILIIFVSWFFSFLGSRVKKQAEQAPHPAKPETDRDAVHLFSDEDDVMESPQQARQFPGLSAPPAESGTTLRQPASAGPQIVPKPIEPKWWGA
jgi:hypothetical protein